MVKLVGNSNLPLIAVPYFLMSFVLLSLIIFVLVSVPSSFAKESDSQQKNTIKHEGIRFRFRICYFCFYPYTSKRSTNLPYSLGIIPKRVTLGVSISAA